MHVDVAIAKMPLEARGAGILLRLIRAALLIHRSCGHFAGRDGLVSRSAFRDCGVIFGTLASIRGFKYHHTNSIIQLKTSMHMIFWIVIILRDH
jgi:hypothetical protein